jgi:hypothetical protein
MGFFSNLAGSFVKQRVTNTKTAFQLIVEDFRRYVIIMKWVFLGLSAATLIYGIVSNTGNLIINCCLIGVLVIYALLDSIFRLRANPNPTRKLRIIYAWIKISLNAVAIAGSVYALYSSTISQVKPIEIVLAALTMMMFILKVFLEITLEVLSSKWALLKNAMVMDAKEYPGTSGKIFSPFIGDIEQIEVKEQYAERIRQKQEKEENK